MLAPYPFRQDQVSTFLRLLNESNPTLTIQPLTTDDLRTLVPTAITPLGGTVQDTQVRLMVKPGNAKYFGAQNVTYRRISLGYLFRNMGYSGNPQTFPVVPVSNYPKYNTSYTVQDLCDELNAKFGLTLVLGDFGYTSNANLLNASGVAWVNLTNSLCYISLNTLSSQSIQIQWTKPKQPINSVVTGTALAGHLYPGGNTFPTDGSRKPQGEFFFYGFDASAQTSAITGLASSGTAIDFTSATWAPILAMLQKARPDLNLTNAQSTTTGGMSGISWTKATLPSATYPNANGIKFASVLVLTAVAGSWFQGNIYLHYAPRGTAGTSTYEGFYLNSSDELTALLVKAGAVAASLGTKDATTGYVVTAIRNMKPAENSPYTSKIRVTMQSGNTVYTGYVDQYLNRLDLGALTKFSPYYISVTPGVSVLTVLDKIRDQYGIQLTSDDINDVQTVDRDGDGAWTTVALTAKATSVKWTGNVTLTFAGLPDISNAFFNGNLTGF